MARRKPIDPAKAAEVLENHNDYRVLRRFTPPTELPARVTEQLDDEQELRYGIFLDTETTGTDPDRDEIIELAMLRFSFTLAGRVVEVVDQYQGYQDPQRPIPAVVTQLTGITDDMVKGQLLSMANVMRLLDGAVLVVAHNASFDRRLVERLWRGEVFNNTQQWACSYRDVDWAARGYRCAKLGHLLLDVRREFFDAHRALDDCHAGVRLLAALDFAPDKVPASFFRELAWNAARPSYRIWATGAPFGVKDQLKQRGYRWDGERRRCWWTDVRTDTERDAELQWLKAGRSMSPDVRAISAYDRYSSRV